MILSESDEFSEKDFDDSGFDESAGTERDKIETNLSNDRYDMVLDVSASMGEYEQSSREVSTGGAEELNANKNLVKNDKFDEAFEVSGSMQSPDRFTMNYHSGRNSTAGNFSRHQGMDMVSEAEERSVRNEAFDAAIDISEDDASVTTTMSAPRPMIMSNSELLNMRYGGSSALAAVLSGSNSIDIAAGMHIQPSMSGSDDESSLANSHSQSHHRGISSIPRESMYDPSEYMNLDVSAEVRDLFRYITSYEVQDMELDTSLKCFIPDYIPTLGEIETFVTVPRPDGKDCELGLKVLDEPCAQQSDAAVLELQLRAITKRKHGEAVVRSIENAHRLPNEIDRWISSIEDLHKLKPPPQVQYKRSMPDVDTLMETWPEEFEKILHSVELPGPDIEISLEHYAKIVCSIMDIPVYENIIESLHLLFTVYQEFRNNSHFAGLGTDFCATSNQSIQNMDVLDSTSLSYQEGNLNRK